MSCNCGNHENHEEQTECCSSGEHGCCCNEEKSELELLKEENEALIAQLEATKSDALRAMADADNFRKRMQKEADERIKYAGTKILESLLPVLDNLEMAISHAEDGNPLKEGVVLTQKGMLEALAKNGLEKINAELGTQFDPAFHEALMLDNTDEYENNSITYILQNGYILNGRVIRPAKVKVNKK